METEWCVPVAFGPVKHVADHIEAQVLVSLWLLKVLIGDREAIGVRISKFESGNFHVNHVKGVSQALLDIVVDTLLERCGPVNTDLLGLLVHLFAH
jgi:hypothetical protein